MTKSELIDNIVDNLQDNIFESKDYIFDLVREALSNRTWEELREINA